MSAACFSKVGAAGDGGALAGGVGGGGPGSDDGTTSVGGFGGCGGSAGPFCVADCAPGCHGPADGSGFPGVCAHAAPLASHNAANTVKPTLRKGTCTG
jgi:hypothetical protein